MSQDNLDNHDEFGNEIVSWDECEHEWKEHLDSQFSNDFFEEVKCIKCGCPGSQNIESKEVYWSAT